MKREKTNYICRNPIHKSNFPTWEGDKKEDIDEVRCSKRLKFTEEETKEGYFGCGEKGFVAIEFQEKESIHTSSLALEDIMKASKPSDLKASQKQQSVPIDGLSTSTSKKNSQKVGSIISITMIDILHKVFYGFLKINLDEIPQDMRENLNQSAMNWIDTLDMQGTPASQYITNLIVVGVYGSLRKINIGNLLKKKDKSNVETTTTKEGVKINDK